MLDPSYIEYHHAKQTLTRGTFSNLEDSLMPKVKPTSPLSYDVTEMHAHATGLNAGAGSSRHIFLTGTGQDFRRLSLVVGPQEYPEAMVISNDADLYRAWLANSPFPTVEVPLMFHVGTKATPVAFSWVKNIRHNEPILKAATVEKFRNLATVWRATRNPVGSALDLCSNFSYQNIIGMGQEAVPLILRDLEANVDHWFWALAAITGATPVKEAHRGRLKLMAEDWLVWGRTQGYRW